MIDWNKPLRTIPSGYPVTWFNFANGALAVSWESPGGPVVVQVDAEGRLDRDDPGLVPVAREGQRIVENVPEAPKDHLVLGHNPHTKETFIYNNGNGKPDLITAEDANQLRYMLNRVWSPSRYFAVKVPT